MVCRYCQGYVKVGTPQTIDNEIVASGALLIYMAVQQCSNATLASQPTS